MKSVIFPILGALLLACNDPNPGGGLPTYATSPFKSDILLENSVQKHYSDPDKKDRFSIVVHGNSLLMGTAVLKITNSQGEEVLCETFPATNLIHADYRNANSVLRESHLREVLQHFFVEGNGYADSLMGQGVAQQ
jgi:hypothetical protein